MKRLLLLLMLSVAWMTMSGCVPRTTGETEVGVRTVKLGLFVKKGVEDKVYAPGSTYFFLPFVNDWHTFETKLHNIEMTHDPKRGDKLYRDDLLFKTIDGGLHWTMVITGLTNLNVVAVNVEPLTPTIVYAATAGGGAWDGIGTKEGKPFNLSADHPGKTRVAAGIVGYAESACIVAAATNRNLQPAGSPEFHCGDHIRRDVEASAQ